MLTCLNFYVSAYSDNYLLITYLLTTVIKH